MTWSFNTIVCSQDISDNLKWNKNYKEKHNDGIVFSDFEMHVHYRLLCTGKKNEIKILKMFNYFNKLSWMSVLWMKIVDSGKILAMSLYYYNCLYFNK
jgi:hypothetical protein